MATAEKTSSQNVNRIIGNVKRSAGAYNGHVQEAICAIIEHAKTFGDCTGAGRLLAAMPKSNRRQLAIDHFEQYSPIAVRLDSKTKQYRASYRKEDDKRYNKFDLDGVRANNWWERNKVVEERELLGMADIYGEFDKFALKLENLVKNERVEANISQKVLAFRAAIRAAAVKFSADEPILVKAAEADEEVQVALAA